MISLSSGMKHPKHLGHHKHKKYPSVPPIVHTHLNLISMVVGIGITVFLAQSQAFTDIILGLGMYRYPMAFVAGILFVLSFAAPVGGLILAMLAKQIPFFLLVAISGIGAVLADLTILKSLNEELLEEIEDILNEFHGKKLIHIFQSPVFKWTLPLLVILILVTPFPDEMAIGLLGMSRLATHRFAVSSFLFNSAGIIFMIGLFILIQGKLF